MTPDPRPCPLCGPSPSPGIDHDDAPEQLEASIAAAWLALIAAAWRMRAEPLDPHEAAAELEAVTARLCPAPSDGRPQVDWSEVA